MAVTFDAVSTAQYVLLTTFTKDGRPKPTPIWIARDGDRALVMTEKNPWKVRRIRNTSRVTLAVCNRGGKVLSEPLEAVATVLDRAITKRYGIVGKLFTTPDQTARRSTVHRGSGNPPRMSQDSPAGRLAPC